MKYRTVLVDDEKLALDRLERMLEPYRDTIEVVGKAESGEDAVAVINRLQPDVVFLDIQMPELSGFDVLERLDYMPLVVFSTAYDQYALRAFEVYSIDYVVKPVDPRRLKTTVDKLLRLSDRGPEELKDRVDRARASLDAPTKNRIQVRVGDKIKLISVSDVVFFLASEKYIEVHTRGEMHLITKSLAKLESELPADQFVRIHRSAIVNIDFIDEITKSFGGSYEVRMKDNKNTRLPISRRHKSSLGLK
jgi:two-component system LytT family response regulator